MHRRLVLRAAVWAALIGCAAVTPQPLGADVIHVDDDALPGGDGTSWQTALRCLQDALRAAESGDEIRIAGGNYRPDEDEAGLVTPGSRYVSFELADQVAIRGGYAGGADPDHPDEHDSAQFETILTGDLAGDDTTDSGTRAENSYHVVTAHDCGSTASLESVTVTAGYADGVGAEERGGGLYLVSGSPTLTRCLFVHNFASFVGGGIHVDCGVPMLVACTLRNNEAGSLGGGLYNFASSPVLVSCSFEDNCAGLIAGGGMANDAASRPSITDCTFTGNVAPWGGGLANFEGCHPKLTDCVFLANQATGYDACGGAVYSEFGSHPTLVNCEFVANLADNLGGGLAARFGCDPVLISCTFTDNSAQAGGAVYNGVEGAPTFTACVFTDNQADYGGAVDNAYSRPTFTRCVLTGNQAAIRGGAIYNYGATDVALDTCLLTTNVANYGAGICLYYSDVQATNCTFYANSASSYGGAAYGYYDSNLELQSCILWQNSANFGPELAVAGSSPPSSASVAHCDVAGGQEAAYLAPGCVLTWGAASLNVNPEFVDEAGPDGVTQTADDNLRLSPASPCINLGAPDYAPPAPTLDLDGHARVLCSRVDMGAYEFGLGDYDCDLGRDLEDFAAWVVCTSGPGVIARRGNCVAFDLDHDGRVDLRDFAAFQIRFTGD